MTTTTTTTDLTARTEFSRGFDRGNYGNACESQDWETWYADNSGDHSEAYLHGMLLGFFSSYELHEIGDEIVAEHVEELRTKYGEE